MPATGRLRGVLTLFCLLLCLSLAALWARSHAARDWVRFHHVSRAGTVRVDRGEFLTYPGVLMFSKYATVHTDPPPGLRQRLARHDGVEWETLVPLKPWVPPEPARRSHRLGFVYQKRSAQSFAAPTTAATTLSAPFWALVIPPALPPAVWLVRRIRGRRRTGRGLCATCGYDLRASPERCPECGTASAPAVTA